MRLSGILFSLLTFITLSTTQSHAGLLLEPVLGYSTGSFEPDGSDKEDISGLSFGGRIGYQKLGFQVGVDYLNSSYSVDNKNYENLNAQDWAAFVGFEFPVFLRVYAGYIFASTAETEYNNVALKLEKGSGTKLGIGLTGLPFVDINFEVRQGNWAEYSSGNTTVKNDVSFNTYMIGVSFPFVL